MSDTLLQIPLEELMVDPNQPRKVFLQAELDRLAASIAARGILHPLRVTRDNERKLWVIVTGESRWRAAKLAGLKTVPCLTVAGLNETDRLADQIVENSCRHDLRPLDLARAMARLKKLKGCTSQDLAVELGVSGASVTRAEALLRLPDDVQIMVDDGRLAESSGYELAKLKDEEEMRRMALMIVAGRMTRDQVTDAVRQKVGKGRSGKKPGKKSAATRAAKLSGKLDGVLFSFASTAGEMTTEALLAALEKLRSKLMEFQKSDNHGVSALADLLRAS